MQQFQKLSLIPIFLRRIVKKKAIFILSTVFVFLMVSFAPAQEVIERFRLGNHIEDITYISAGELAGKCAFVDGWHVYIFDLDTGGYEKLFYYGDLNIRIPARGIAYISTGVYAGNFLMNDVTNADTLFIVTASGDLVSEVKAVDFKWEPHCEGITEIISGSYQGFFAMIGFFPTHNNPHIYIFSIEGADDIVNARLVKDISIEGHYTFGICFLDDTYPDPAFRNHFVLSYPIEGRLGVFDDEGNIKESFAVGDYNYEGLAYFNNDLYQGKLMVADGFAEDTWVMNLNGTDRIHYEIATIIKGSMRSITWLDISNQLVLVWNQRVSSNPSIFNRKISFISRQSPEDWNKDSEIIYSHLHILQDIIQLTPDGMYYLLGWDRIEWQFYPKVHKVDSNFSPITEYPLNKRFSTICYVPGEIRDDDKFAMVPLFERTKVYMFDSFFSNSDEIDLSGKVEEIYDIHYDSAKERYYVLEYEPLLHVFDSTWNLIGEYDLSPYVPRWFSRLTKITSGDLKGNMAFLNQDDCEIVIINLEPQIINSQIENLIEEVQIGEIDQGVQISLIRQLENVKSSIEKENINAAIHQMLAFQHKIQAQSGKKIPVSLAEQWMDFSESVIQYLEDL